MSPQRTAIRISKKSRVRAIREMRNADSTFYHLSSGETIEKTRGRFNLLQNYTDSTNTFVVIEFYLPKPADAKLILMDSDLKDSMYLINKELKAGRHILKTQIRNVELLSQKYYYKLEAYGVADTKRMSYTYKAVDSL